MRNRHRVVVVDGQPLFRMGAVLAIQNSKRFEVVGIGATANDAVRLAHYRLPDIILLDTDIAGGGIETARHIARAYPKIKTIMLTVAKCEEHASLALRSGVQGVIHKTANDSELIDAMWAVARGDSYLRPRFGTRLLKRMTRPLPTLTQREGQIVERLTRGLTNREIARGLTVSEKTVKNYMTIIMQKLNARNRVEAVLVLQRGSAES